MTNNGSLVINRAGALGISAVISGTGGLIQGGSGTTGLTGANTYTGDTTISGGILSISSAYLADSGAVHLTSGAVLNLTHTAVDVIDSLTIDGVLQSAGIWGAIGSGAAHQTSLITGTGFLQATNGVTSMQLWAANHGMSGASAAPDADPDGDGVPNILEFALDGNPQAAGSGGLAFARISAGGDFTYTIAVRSGALFAAAEYDQTATIDGIAYTVEASSDLADWGATVSVLEVLPAVTTGLPVPDSGWEYHTFRTDGGPSVVPQAYFHVLVEAQAP